jgi:hypothetical protein
VTARRRDGVHGRSDASHRNLLTALTRSSWATVWPFELRNIRAESALVFYSIGWCHSLRRVELRL